MNRRASLVRGIVTLAVIGGLAGALIASPVGAAGTLTKQKVKKIATKVFNSLIGGATAGNAQKLDNLDSAEFLQDSEVRWAVVAANGALLRGRGVTSSSKEPGIDPGLYNVTFPQDVSQCAYAATIDGSPVLGQIGASPRSGQANTVFVTTENSSGAAADKKFHLIVICG